jgi:hypothetical protein
MYKLNKDIEGKISSITKNDGSALKLCIPLDTANTDYQAYLKFLADGGTPLPAENT